jgi:nucleoside-diphosphate-sugar epimerase
MARPLLIVPESPYAALHWHQGYLGSDMAQTSLPDQPPRTVTELEEQLSSPSPEVIETIARCDADIVLLGVAGKMGPTMARMARRAMDQAGIGRRVIGVSRFSDPAVREKLQSWNIETISADLLEPDQVRDLPDAGYVVQLAGFKFGASSAPLQLWATNCQVPMLVCERYQDTPIVAFSTGSLYGMVPAASGGSKETDSPRPDGAYSMAAVCRENILRYYSQSLEIPMVILRLNYATELRYGVLVDLAIKVLKGEPVDRSMTHVNVIWLSDANAMTLRALEHCQAPARILNMTGPDILNVPDLCQQMANQLGRDAVLEGSDSELAFLNNASLSYPLLGAPQLDAETMIRWTCDWVRQGGENLGKPTKFQVTDGTY